MSEQPPKVKVIKRSENPTDPRLLDDDLRRLLLSLRKTLAELPAEKVKATVIKMLDSVA